MIYSENVKVFKNDGGNKLSKPINVDIITSPAPNAGVAKNRGVDFREIDNALRNRIFKIIQLAINKKVDTLFLGAFGCGVFKNDSQRVALHFKDAINQLIPKGSMEIKFIILGRIPRGFN